MAWFASMFAVFVVIGAAAAVPHDHHSSESPVRRMNKNDLKSAKKEKERLEKEIADAETEALTVGDDPTVGDEVKIVTGAINGRGGEFGTVTKKEHDPQAITEVPYKVQFNDGHSRWYEGREVEVAGRPFVWVKRKTTADSGRTGTTG